MGSPSSSAQQARQALGNRLREIRTDAGLTGRDLAALAGWHSSKVSKIEFGKQNATPDDIRVWCRHAGATAQTDDLLASLRAVDDMFVEWHRMERTGLRAAQEAVVPLWERTRRFRIYSSWVIPGPLQTAAYIRAILTDIMRRRDIVDDVDDAVRVRVEKQHVIHEGDHTFAIVLEESVLRYAIGGPEVMAAQLGHLLSVGALPSVSLGIIPLAADRSRMWPVEPFWMFDDGLARVELVSGHLSITTPGELAMYADTFAELSEQAVHGPAARNLISAAIAALD
jgi:transcriptional regulator with XRE-family HTH domain